MPLFGSKPDVEKMEAKCDVNGLVKALKNQDSDVRSAASEALVKIGNANVVDALVISLKDKDFGVRSSAAETLGKICDKRIVNELVVSLKDQNANVRSAAAKSLAKTGDSNVVDPLIVSLKDSDPEVRASAAQSLGRIGDVHAVESLVAALKDPHSSVRWSAAEGLGKIGDARTADVLVVSLKDPNPEVRASAAESLGKIGDAKTVPALTVSLQFDPAIKVRESAAGAMKELEKKIRSGSCQPFPMVVGSPVTGLRSEEEKTVAIRPQSTLDVEDVELAKKLAQLSNLSDIQYATDRAAYEKTAAEFRRIGEQVCANGGDERMRRIALQLQAFGGRSQDCEMYWAGICGWAV